MLRSGVISGCCSMSHELKRLRIVLSVAVAAAVALALAAAAAVVVAVVFWILTASMPLIKIPTCCCCLAPLKLGPLTRHLKAA